MGLYTLDVSRQIAQYLLNLIEVDGGENYGGTRSMLANVESALRAIVDEE